LKKKKNEKAAVKERTAALLELFKGGVIHHTAEHLSTGKQKLRLIDDSMAPAPHTIYISTLEIVFSPKTLLSRTAHTSRGGSNHGALARRSYSRSKDGARGGADGTPNQSPFTRFLSSTARSI